MIKHNIGLNEYLTTQNLNTTAASVKEVTAHDIHHDTAFYLQAEFWVGISFVLVVLLIAKPVGKIVKSMMQKRINLIINRISEASNLKKDSESVLQDYETKFSNTKKEANAILTKAKKEIEFIKKESFEKLNYESSIKQKEAEERINNAKDKALNEIINSASELALKTVKTVLSKKLDNKAQDKLIDESISLISSFKP